MKLLISLALCLLSANAWADSRPLANCDTRATFEKATVSSGAATQFFSVTSTVPFQLNNLNGTYIDQRRKVCFKNLDSNGTTNYIFVSSFVYTAENYQVDFAVKNSSIAYPINGLGSECFDWGSAIPTYIFKAQGVAASVVNAYNCR